MAGHIRNLLWAAPKLQPFVFTRFPSRYGPWREAGGRNKETESADDKKSQGRCIRSNIKKRNLEAGVQETSLQCGNHALTACRVWTRSSAHYPSSLGMPAQ